jgi:hypothetical protein
MITSEFRPFVDFSFTLKCHNHHHIHEGLGCFFFLDPQNEIGPSISSSVILLVYILTLVLVFTLKCKSTLCFKLFKLFTIFHITFFTLHTSKCKKLKQ